MLLTMYITSPEAKTIKENHGVAGDKRRKVFPKHDVSSEVPPLKYMARGKKITSPVLEMNIN